MRAPSKVNVNKLDNPKRANTSLRHGCRTILTDKPQSLPELTSAKAIVELLKRRS